MNQSERYIKGAASLASSFRTENNNPSQYASKEKEYFAERNRVYGSERAYLSSDYVSAEAQGITEDFYEFVKTNVRLSDIVSPSAGGKRVDDFKEVLLAERGITYIPIGAKMQTMGSTWLVINPSDLSSVYTKTVVGRCNASFNSYDYYGNVVTEPLIVEKLSMLGNDNEKEKNIVLMDGYFNMTCQLNPNTKQLTENSRIILGKKAYYITGFTDFIQEFTGDLDSSHLITFTARVTEPTENDDITDLYIANAYSTVFAAQLNGQDSLRVGGTAVLTPYFLKNGDVVEATEEYPLAWIYKSSDESVATVDENGTVRAIGEGTVTITANLLYNPSIVAECELAVGEEETNPYVEFLGFVEPYILQYTTATYDAAYFADGAETSEALSWSFSGAESHDYNATVSDDGKSVTVECVSASDVPLQITASCNGAKKTVSVELCGY